MKRPLFILVLSLLIPAGSFCETAEEALLRMAQAQFSPLFEAETKVLQAAAAGTQAVIANGNEYDAANEPRYSETGDPVSGTPCWGDKRNVRAALLRWMLMDRQASANVDPAGIQILGARILGTLHLAGLQIKTPLHFRFCRFQYAPFFEAAELQSLDMEGSWTPGVNLDFVVVKHGLSLHHGFHSDGEVLLRRARIGQDLNMADARIFNASKDAISAAGIEVGGYAFLRADVYRERGEVEGFYAEGTVSLVGANISRDLDFGGAQFCNHGGVGLNINRAVVGGMLMMNNTQDMHNRLHPFGIGGVLDLRYARCRVVQDSPNSWPSANMLRLDGFVYEGTSGEGWNAEKRLRWIGLDPLRPTQPYRQLTKVFQAEGRTKEAETVSRVMEAKLSRVNDPPLLGFLRFLVAYGYEPWRAVFGLLFLTIGGWWIYAKAYQKQQIQPTDDAAYALHVVNPATLPANYPRFYALVYSFENTFPLVTLGQAEHWRPVPASFFLQGVYWLQIVFGWLFATVFLAAISGVIQHG